MLRLLAISGRRMFISAGAAPVKRWILGRIVCSGRYRKKGGLGCEGNFVHQHENLPAKCGAVGYCRTLDLRRLLFLVCA